MKTGKLVLLTTVSVIGILVLIGCVIAWAVYPIEADRPDDISADLWFDTKDFYNQTAKTVDDTLDGKYGNISIALPEWEQKYIGLTVGTDTGTDSEKKLAKAMLDMREAALKYESAIAQDKIKSTAATKEQIEKTQERYEDAKRSVEKILYIWK